MKPIYLFARICLFWGVRLAKFGARREGSAGVLRRIAHPARRARGLRRFGASCSKETAIVERPGAGGQILNGIFWAWFK